MGFRASLILAASLAALAPGSGLPAPAAAAPRATARPESAAAPAERWYAITVDGAPAGWAREGRRTTDAGVETDSAMRLRVRRGGSALEIDLEGRFVETPAGRPVSLWTRRLLGSSPVETTYRFGADGVEATTRQGGRELREELPLPTGEWLSPEAARRVVAAHHRAGDREYSVRTIDPVAGLEPVTIRRTWLGEPTAEEREAGAAGRWREEQSGAPGVASEVALDDRGEVVRSRTPFLGLQMTLQLTDRESALAAAGAAPELLVATFVRPDRPIEHPRSVHRASYLLTLPEGSVPDLPSEGAQRAERRGAGIEVTVVSPEVWPEGGPENGAGGDVGEPSSDPRPAPPADQDGAPGEGYLEPSVYLDFRDPAVAALAARATAGPSDADHPRRGAGGEPIRRAEDLTRFVHGWVRAKDLDSGFATASEVAASRSGDCTEHSVLLAALLRAEGIPSRVVTGLVYLDAFAGSSRVFGYHMWVQARIDGRWLDLDPTILAPQPGGFDATHIALATSTLDGPDAGRSLDRLMPLFGKLRIEVLDAR